MSSTSGVADDVESGSDLSDNESSKILESTRDAVICLIDTTASMLASKEGFPPFEMALKTVLNMLKTKILMSDNDYLGIVLFGTNKAKAPKDIGDYPNTYVLRDLEKPEVAIIKDVDEMLNSNTYNGLKDLATDPPIYALADALWLCNSMFSKRCKGRETKRLFIFTDNDDPYFNNAALKKQAERRAADLRDASIELVLFPMILDFDSSKFYRELLTEGEGNVVTTPIGSVEDLLVKVKRRVHKKRITAKLLFDLGNNVKFSVGLYNLVRPAPNPKRITLDARTNEPVKSVTTKFNVETGDMLLSSELTKYVTFGNTKIVMDPLDIKRIKSMYSPGLKLLGFKPVEEVKSTYYYSPSSFIHPDEDVVKGSKMLFGSLLERCAARGVAPICRMVASHARSPRMVALLPQLEEKDESGEQINPPGFHVYFLPFADDFRALPCREFVGPEEDEPWVANEEQVEAAKTMILKVSNKKFKLEQIPDPALHKKWSTIESQALEKEQAEDDEKDFTLPDEAKMSRKLENSDLDFVGLVYPVGYNPEESVSRTTGSRVKTHKELPTADVESEIRAGRAKKLTVDILKHYLQSKGLKNLSGKRKDDLLALALEQVH